VEKAKHSSVNPSAASTAIVSPASLSEIVEKPPAKESEVSGIVDLTRGLAAGNEAAFREFHDQYFDRLFRYVLVITYGNEEAARDALQETFLRVVRHAKRFDTEDAFWNWLTVLARSAALDGGRKQQRYWKLLTNYARSWLVPNEFNHYSTNADTNLEDLLQSALEQISKDDRSLIEAKYFHRATVKELAAKNGLTEKAVESRLLRARRQLRKHLLERANHENT
jgi:RNA polymerase sigma-70 factor (ECF subfamily)